MDNIATTSLMAHYPGWPGWAGTRKAHIQTHTHTHDRSMALWNLSRTTWVSSSWSSIIPICFLHLLRSMASSVFNPRALQYFSTISLQVFFGHIQYTFPVYLLLTTTTLYWITTNASTTDTTWPSYHLLRYPLPFPTNHNLDFIHIYPHSSIVAHLLKMHL